MMTTEPHDIALVEVPFDGDISSFVMVYVIPELRFLQGKGYYLLLIMVVILLIN